MRSFGPLILGVLGMRALLLLGLCVKAYVGIYLTVARICPGLEEPRRLIYVRV